MGYWERVSNVILIVMIFVQFAGPLPPAEKMRDMLLQGRRSYRRTVASIENNNKVSERKKFCLIFLT